MDWKKINWFKEIRWFFGIGLLLFAWYSAMSQKGYIITDQYGNPIPKEELQFWINEYNNRQSGNLSTSYYTPNVTLNLSTDCNCTGDTEH